MNDDDTNDDTPENWQEAMHRQFHDQNILCHFHVEHRKGGVWEKVGGGVTNLPVGNSFSFLANAMLTSWLEESISKEDRKADGWSITNYRVFLWIMPDDNPWVPAMEDDDRKEEHDDKFNHQNAIVCQQAGAYMPQDIPGEVCSQVARLVLMGVLEGWDVTEKNGTCVIKIIPVNGAELKTNVIGVHSVLNGLYVGWLAGRSELPAHFLSAWERHRIDASKRKNTKQTKKRKAAMKAAEKDPLAILTEAPEEQPEEGD